MSISDEQILAGQAVYTKGYLSIYDAFVLYFACPVIWHCPQSEMHRLYERHVSSNHLDVGVGTGLFLDRVSFPSAAPRVGLMDLNQNCLDAAEKRIARYRPEKYRHNVFERVSQAIAPFDSIGMNFLLHCLPGDMETEKVVVFENLKALMKPGAVLFGSTILHDGVKKGLLARMMMAMSNRAGVFSNTRDSLSALETALRRTFAESAVEVKGCVALFTARR